MADKKNTPNKKVNKPNENIKDKENLVNNKNTNTTQTTKDLDKDKSISPNSAIINNSSNNKSTPPKAEDKANKSNKSKVDNKAKTTDTAKVDNKAKVADSTKVDDKVKAADTAKIDEKAKVADTAKLDEKAKVADTAKLDDKAKVADTTKVDDKAKVADSIKADNKMKVADTTKADDKAKTTAKADDKAKATDTAKADDKAKVADTAKVNDKAKVADSTKADNKVKATDTAKIDDKAKVADTTKADDKAKTTDTAKADDKAKVADTAKADDKAKATDATKADDKKISEDDIAKITHRKDKPVPVPRSTDSGFSQFFKKYRLPILLVCALLIIGIAITSTVLIVNRHNVSISSAEDFLEVPSEKKTTYVLKNDIEVESDLVIPNGMNLDLNDYTLTVLGTLTYGSDAGDKDIYIGDKRTKIILRNGHLIVDNLEINSPDASMTIYSTFEGNANIVLKSLVIKNTFTSAAAGDINIDATSFTLESEVIMNGEDSSFTLESNKSVIDGDFTATGANSTFNITSPILSINGIIACNQVNISGSGDGDNESIINGTINGMLNIVTSSITINKEAVVDAITSDDVSDLEILGTITTSITGGNIIVFKDGSQCPLVTDAIKLNIYEGSNVNEIVGVTDILFYEQLNKPADIAINQVDSSLMCYVAQVNYADEYVLFIDNDEKGRFDTNEFEITSFITKPGNHNVSVKAISNSVNLLDSPAITMDYIYNIKLNTPEIEINSSEGFYIIFTSVPFAHKYDYTINNGDTQSFSDFEAGEVVAINITDDISAAGSYVVKVIAYGVNAEAFEPSATATTSFIKNITLATVTTDEEPVSITRDGNTLLLEWDAITYGNYYSIYLDDELITKTRNTSYQWTLGDIPDNTPIKVVADAHGYYIDSIPAEFTYNYELLEQVDVTQSINNTTITLTWSAVDNAQSYSLYLDGVLVTEDLTTTSYSFEHQFATSGTYTIEAVAEYFTSSISDGEVIAIPTIEAPVINGLIDGDNVRINWSAVDYAEAYILYLDGVAVTEIEGTSYTVEYSTSTYGDYTVIAIADNLVNSDSSNTINIENLFLEAPILDYDINASDATFTWNSVTNAQAYELYRVGDPDDTLIETITSGTTTTIVTGDAEYYLVAIATGYRSATSNTVTIVIMD